MKSFQIKKVIVFMYTNQFDETANRNARSLPSGKNNL